MNHTEGPRAWDFALPNGHSVRKSELTSWMTACTHDSDLHGRFWSSSSWFSADGELGWPSACEDPPLGAAQLSVEALCPKGAASTLQALGFFILCEALEMSLPTTEISTLQWDAAVKKCSFPATGLKVQPGWEVHWPTPLPSTPESLSSSSSSNQSPNVSSLFSECESTAKSRLYCFYGKAAIFLLIFPSPKINQIRIFGIIFI